MAVSRPAQDNAFPSEEEIKEEAVESEQIPTEPTDQNVGPEIDMKVELASIDENADIEPEQNGDAPTMNYNETLRLEDLRIEREEEQEIGAQERVFDEPELPLPDDLFFGFNVYVPGQSDNDIDANYKSKIEKCGGSILYRPDSSVTHIFFQEK